MKITPPHRFELPGSFVHETPLPGYKIEHMTLKISPDFKNTQLINCNQELVFKIYQETLKIELDITDIQILAVRSNSLKISDYECIENKKLVIHLGKSISDGDTISIFIEYSAGFQKQGNEMVVMRPRAGFHFITKENQISKERGAYQSWTQGESTETRYWFPCMESPQVKFTLKLEATVPSEFEVIANGILESKIKKDHVTTWTFVENTPLPAYLVSVVVGKFSKYEILHNGIPLAYYWPEDIKKEDAMLTFSETPKMIEFFEDYFDSKYPFKKYAQVAVDSFEFGGMENSSCTTFTREVFHDQDIGLEYKNDLLLIVHELAHQWFGDLVTCKDWSHIWLNEGFATYCESLYWYHTRGKDEFLYGLIEIADNYFEEAKESYIRPIVTNFYKHPDELFDSHSYEKAGFVLHMLRHYIGESYFKKSLSTYLKNFTNLSVDSIDLINTIEKVSGKRVQTFFDQWIFNKGHPEVEIEYTFKRNYYNQEFDGNSSVLKIKVIQLPTPNKSNASIIPFKYSLDIKVKTADSKGNSNETLHTMQISENVSECELKLDEKYNISYIAIDPELKILKKIKSIKVMDENGEFYLNQLLINQMNFGGTVFEKIDALRLLRSRFNERITSHIQNLIINGGFYGVGVVAAETLGSYHNNHDFEKSNTAFKVLFDIITDSNTFDKLHPKVKKSILKNIGTFERYEAIKPLRILLNSPEKYSDFIKSTIVIAIGNSCKNSPLLEAKLQAVNEFKDLVNNSESFQNIISTSALEGVAGFYKYGDGALREEIITLILENTLATKDYFIRSKSTKLLGRVLRVNQSEAKLVNDEINQKVFDRLKELLVDDRRRIKINACEALSDESARFTSMPDEATYQSIKVLVELAQKDTDGFVRRKAEESANKIREWINEWSNQFIDISTAN